MGIHARFAELACLVLRGERPAWPDHAMEPGSSFAAFCDQHGIAPLVSHLLKKNRQEESWPPELVAELRRLAWGNRCLQELNDAELRKLIDELDERGIDCLFLKGAGLARSHFPQPHLRPRTDTDLLIRRRDLDRVIDGLRRLGYQKSHTVTGEFLMYQVCYVREDPNGYRHAFDVHWKVANPQVFAQLFEFEELSSRSVSVPISAGTSATTLSAVDSLLLACLHRVAHHKDHDRLIWLYDIHLLAEGLDSAQSELFRELTSRKQLTAVVEDGLRKCHDLLGTRMAGLIDQTQETDEATGRFLTGSGKRRAILWSDFRALPGWGPKLRLLKEHLFPPPEYMFRHYSTQSRLVLPFLYVHRALRGTWGILRGKE